MSTSDLDAAETKAVKTAISCHPGQVHYMHAAQGATIIVTQGWIDLSYRAGRMSWLLDAAAPIALTVSDGSAFVMPCAAAISVLAGGRKSAAFFLMDAQPVASESWTTRVMSTILATVAKRRSAWRGLRKEETTANM